MKKFIKIILGIVIVLGNASGLPPGYPHLGESEILSASSELPVPPQPKDLKSIVVNDISINDKNESKWLKNESIINILGSDNEAKITIAITPDSGRIDVSYLPLFPVKIYLDTNLCESQPIQLPKNIKKYKVSININEEAEEEYVSIIIKSGYKIVNKPLNWLGVPLIPELVRFLIGKKSTVEILPG